MSLLDKAQNIFRQLRGENVQPSEESMYSRRLDGSLSGYHPNAVGRQQAQESSAPAGASTPEPPVESWTTPPPPPVAYQPEPQVMQGNGQQPMADAYNSYAQPGNAYPPAWNYAQPQTQFQPQPQDQGMAYPVQTNSYLSTYPTQGNNQQSSPFVGYQAANFPVSTQIVPASTGSQPAVPDNISYMPGAFVGRDGKEYLHRVRVAQVRGVSDCYPLMECMRNNETVVVNLDSVQDAIGEVGRCLDLLYGACYALQCQFSQVSTNSVYLVTPGVVEVEHSDELRRQSDYEIDNRWPDPSSLGYRQRASARDPYSGYGQGGGYGQSGYSQSSYAQGGYTSNYQNYGGMGRRSSGGRSSSEEYSDFGGFPNAGRF